jgi:hypothetical protein
LGKKRKKVSFSLSVGSSLSLFLSLFLSLSRVALGLTNSQSPLLGEKKKKKNLPHVDTLQSACFPIEKYYDK